MPGGRTPVRVTLVARWWATSVHTFADRTRVAHECVGNDSRRDFLAFAIFSAFDPVRPSQEAVLLAIAARSATCEA
jgi:hypothetical protein